MKKVISRLYFLGCLSLICLSFAFLLGTKSADSELHTDHSYLFAKMSLDVTSLGFFPHLSTNHHFSEYPFIFFWINGGIMRLLGPSTWSAQVLTAFSFTGCLILILLLGYRSKSRFFGFLAALISLAFKEIFFPHTVISLELFTTLLILASYYSWMRSQWKWTFFLGSLGVLTNPPTGFITFPLLWYASHRRKSLEADSKNLLRCLLISISCLVVGWITIGILGGWGIVLQFWIKHLLGAQPNRDSVPYASQLGLICLFFFILITTQLATQSLRSLERWVYIATVSGVPLFLAVILCVPSIKHESDWDAIRRFIPIIQSNGECTDEVILLPDHLSNHPSLKSANSLHFFTGKEIFLSECTSIGTAIQNINPEWVILSKEAYERCLTPQEQLLFKMKFKFQNHYLLSSVPFLSQATNLSQLENVLIPNTTCASTSVINRI